MEASIITSTENLSAYSHGNSYELPLIEAVEFSMEVVRASIEAVESSV